MLGRFLKGRELHPVEPLIDSSLCDSYQMYLYKFHHFPSIFHSFLKQCQLLIVSLFVKKGLRLSIKRSVPVLWLFGVVGSVLDIRGYG